MRRTMKACAGIALSIMTLAIGGSGIGNAMSLSGAGARFGFASPEHADGTLAVGGHLEFEQPDSRLHLMPGFLYWKVNGLSDLSLNGDLTYHFSTGGRLTPYVGAGLGLNAIGRDGGDSSVDLGVNLISGLQLPGNGLHTFVETRYTVSDVSHFALLGGVTFHLP